jgi:predicted phage terminase large subunit-like protein
MSWSVCYLKAVLPDGSLLFPERLSQEFLEQARRTMGSYIYANQYQNEIIPEGDKVFRPEWLRYYNDEDLPTQLIHFAFVDPAISQQEGADYTALVVIAVDCNRNWYVRHARRTRINPSQLIELLFQTHAKWRPAMIGIEDVGFQQAILHFATEEMRRRQIQLPITGIKRGPDQTKEARILGLVPRFEWGTLKIAKHQTDLELELGQFPRGAHDDILDALSSCEEIVHYPAQPRRQNGTPSANDPGYEHWYIQQLVKGRTPFSGPDQG